MTARDRTRRCRWWLVAVTASLLLALACSDEQPGERPGTDAGPSELPDQQISDFVLRETSGGMLAWVFKADTALVYEQQNEIRATQLTVDFYDDLGEVTSVLTARHGTVHRRTNAMRAVGEVVVRARDGRVLETETLDYSPRTNKVTSEDFVRLQDGENLLTGYGLESDPDLRDGTFEIKRDVRATVIDLPTDTDGS